MHNQFQYNKLHECYIKIQFLNLNYGVIGSSSVLENNNLVDVVSVQEINNVHYVVCKSLGDDERDIDDYCDRVGEVSALKLSACN
jgi:hypothetical protein